MGIENDRLAVLATVPHEFEAEMIVGALNRRGIQATATGGFVSNFKAEAPGNVRIMVRQTDLDRATAVLEDVREGRREPPPE